ENPVFEENTEQVKEEYHLAEIKTEEPVEETKEISSSPDHHLDAEQHIVQGEPSLHPVSVSDDEEEHRGFELSFEPYHTIDYFASQGIKFVQEENPTDKFGKQLKTFTAWLKVMKKLPQHAMREEPDAQRTAEIEMIAADSIKEKEVETETMAEVLAKQGKIDKAIELYLKLSLLNPTKIAYFAAKIEQIKKGLL
ncbi:MAG: hypothetical protein JST75_07820, partial [Bacteroidetes bacterium]|nr:hypothetical protein [Bacteroidota bacterium]